LLRANLRLLPDFWLPEYGPLFLPQRGSLGRSEILA
jgi:hypothetical protein